VVTFSFTKEDDALYAQGWPHLRRIVDAPLTRRAIVTTLVEELSARSPVFGVEVHRDVASAFLRAMTHARDDIDARKKAIADPRAVDDYVLGEVIDRLCPSLTAESYEFRVHDAVFLLEALLGAEPVAEALVSRFVLAAKSPKLWEDAADPRDHAFHLANALGYLGLRLPADRFKALTKPLRSLTSKSLFADRLALLIDRKASVRNGKRMQSFAVPAAMERGDRDALRGLFDPLGSEHWYSPRFFYVAGADLLDRVKMTKLGRLPGWLQKRIIKEHGTIRHPGTVRVIMWLLASDLVKAEAAAWLVSHRAFARPVLEAITDPKETAHAHAALAILGGTRGKTKPLDPKVAKKLQTIFRSLEKELLAADENLKAEIAVLKAAFTKYSDARGGGGDASPAFTHDLADLPWKTGDETVTRWMELAVDVADA
jgi:hypothetical protein